MTPEEKQNHDINHEADLLEDRKNERHFKEAERQALSDHHFGCLARTALGLRRKANG